MNALIKTGKTIFNALAFANADNYSEFQTLLNQTERNEQSAGKPAQFRLVSVTKDSDPIAPAGPRLHQVV